MGSRPAPEPARRGSRPLRRAERHSCRRHPGRRPPPCAPASRSSAERPGGSSRSRPRGRSSARSRPRSSSSRSSGRSSSSTSPRRRSSPPRRSWRSSTGASSPSPSPGRVVGVAVYLAGTAGTQAGTSSPARPPRTGRRSSASVRFGYLDARDARVGMEDPTLDVVFTQDTQYHRLAVVDDADSRYLRFDNSLQSAMYLDDPLRTRYRLHGLLPPRARVQPRRAATSCSSASGPARRRSGCCTSSTTCGSAWWSSIRSSWTSRYRYFDGPAERPAPRVDVGDGRQFLARNDKRWDVIVIDAFFADAIPFHLVTREFLELARSRLTPGGVVVTNAIGALEGVGSRLFRSIYKTYRGVFPTVLVHPGARGRRPRRRGISQPDPRRGRRSRAGTGLPRRPLGRHPRGASRRPGPRAPDPRPPRPADPHERRAAPDGRLRAHRRPPPPVPIGHAEPRPPDGPGLDGPTGRGTYNSRA